MNEIHIRLIDKNDNEALAVIIRSALKEFGANKPGTVYFDDTTDKLFELFQQPKAAYHIVTVNNEVVGGGGIFYTEGLDADTCELVKLYLSPESRGLGLGKILINKCLQTAVEFGFKKVYLETMPELTSAVPMYENFGFTYLTGPMGNSGHGGCDIWMIKQL